MLSAILLGMTMAVGQTPPPAPRPNEVIPVELGLPQAIVPAEAKGEPQKDLPPLQGQPKKAAQPKKEDLPAPREIEAGEDVDPIAKALPAPELEPGEEGLVISLPAALQLANAQAWDIRIAVQQMQIAVAQRQQADVLWVPTIIGGVDYQYHSGPIQNIDGSISNASHSNMYAGGAPLAIFALTDAIFTPLQARQIVRAQDANIQTSRNDTLTDMAQSYFDLLEAEADLAAILDVDRRAALLVKKVNAIAPDLVGTVELARVKALKFNIVQVTETARQRWRNASAEVDRIARLRPTVVLQPLEPPHVRVTLVPETYTPDELLPIALANRPELTFYEAQARAALDRARQEKWRPFLPTVIARGAGTTPPFPMAVGGYGGGTGTDLNNFQQRSDWDFSAVWTLQNGGLGNLALIRERNREYDLARSREYRFRDLVLREVTVAWSDVRSAARRVAMSEQELKEANLSAKQNLRAVGLTKSPQGPKVGGLQILVIRPQEVVQALQALNSAYFNYYGVVAEYNRAQFRLYRAIGNPAQMIAGHNGLGGPPIEGHEKAP